MNSVLQSREYRTIAKFYGELQAKRSGDRLMLHIDEGLEILSEIGASEEAKRAFCLHPIVQMGENVDLSWSDVLPLATEYAQKANSYLCVPETDHIVTVVQLTDLVGPMSEDCRQMLWADKTQNFARFAACLLASIQDRPSWTNTSGCG